MYTEIKKKNNKKYFYRVRTVRTGALFKKVRVYLGKDLSKLMLSAKIKRADRKLEKNNELAILIPKIESVLQKYDIKKAGIFGSYARGDQKKKSDIDIIIEPPPGIGLEFITIRDELEKTLRKKVDLVTYDGLSPYLKKYILGGEVRILGKRA
ncbi:MAG TPA: nucleotidyltransferase family protein [Candidatus Nanoarchaeia archaeon]|nr:nucleotidyltransferase family protein [Candidatus Nanoarchaeia archaeon]